MGIKNSRRNILTRARQQILVSELNDTSARLAIRNLQHGMAKIIYVMDEIDPKSNINFYGSLDFTITKSEERWGAGFAYGGLIDISTNERIIFPEIRPNSCGTIVGSLREDISENEVISRIEKVQIDSGTSNWDYGRKNHFINLYRSKQTGKQVFIIHGCPSRLKSDGDHGEGLYLERSKYWKENSETINTPVGDIVVLLEDKADKYWNNYQRYEQYSKDERSLIAQKIFGDFTLICNESHEGMRSMHQYILGCHAALEYSEVFPIMTTIGKPAYLVGIDEISEINNVTPHGIKALIPHGTGYDLHMDDPEIEVILSESGQRLFQLKKLDRGGTEVYRNFAHVPFKHRSPNLVDTWKERGFFNICDTLEPLIFTKF